MFSLTFFALVGTQGDWRVHFFWGLSSSQLQRNRKNVSSFFASLFPLHHFHSPIKTRNKKAAQQNLTVECKMRHFWASCASCTVALMKRINQLGDFFSFFQFVSAAVAEFFFAGDFSLWSSGKTRWWLSSYRSKLRHTWKCFGLLDDKLEFFPKMSGRLPRKSWTLTSQHSTTCTYYIYAENQHEESDQEREKSMLWTLNILRA